MSVGSDVMLPPELRAVDGWVEEFTGAFTRDRLCVGAVSQWLLSRPAPEVLFVRPRNVARSQLAAAVVAHEPACRVVVRSAGTAPATAVRPMVLQVLAEAGIDAGGACPKPLTEESVAAADVVVTMGCGDSCPVLPGRRYLDWNLPDPDGAPLEVVRAVRDDVTAWVRALLAEIDIVQVAQ